MPHGDMVITVVYLCIPIVRTLSDLCAQFQLFSFSSYQLIAYMTLIKLSARQKVTTGISVLQSFCDLIHNHSRSGCI